jgi:hypothetical protein
MPTECCPGLFDFAPVEGRQVVGAFDGGVITSDAGALLLGATDRAIRLTERFTACFADRRMPELVEHKVGAMVMQRVFGIALGYEDLTDHDELRHDPVLGVLAGKLAARRSDCAALAGKSTLNRLELSPDGADALSQDQSRRRRHRGAVHRSVSRRASPRPGADHPRPRRHRRSAARPSRGPVLPRLLRLLLLPASVRLLWPSSARR